MPPQVSATHLFPGVSRKPVQSLSSLIGQTCWGQKGVGEQARPAPGKLGPRREGFVGSLLTCFHPRPFRAPGALGMWMSQSRPRPPPEMALRWIMFGWSSSGSLWNLLTSSVSCQWAAGGRWSLRQWYSWVGRGKSPSHPFPGLAGGAQPSDSNVSVT